MKKIRLWSLIVLVLSAFCVAQERPQLLLQKGHGGNTDILATSPLVDARLAATAGSDGTVKVWDLQERHVTRTIYDEASYPNPDETGVMGAAAFSPDKAWVVTRDSKGVFRRFSLPDGKLLGSFTDPDSTSSKVLLTDGTSLFYFHHKKLLRCQLDGQLEASAEYDDVSDDGYIDLSPDRTLLALKTSDGVSTLDAKTLQERSFKELGSRTQGLRFSGDSQKLALSTDTAFAILNSSSLAVERLVEKPEDISGQRLLPYWNEANVTLIPYGSGYGKPLMRVESSADTFTPFGTEFVATSGSLTTDNHYLLGGYGGQTFVIDAATGERDVLSSDIAGFTAFAVDSKSRDLVTGSRNGQVVRWSSQTGRVEQRYEGLKAWVASVDVSPDGSKVLGADYSYGDVICWDAKSGKILSQVHLYPPGTRSGANFGAGARFAQFVDSDRFLLSFTQKSVLKLVQASTGQELNEWATAGSPTCFAVNSSGTRIAVGYPQGLMEASLSSKRDVLSISLGRDRAQDVAYGSDGKTVYAGSANGVLYQWDSSDPKNKAASLWNSGLRDDLRLLGMTGSSIEVATRRGKLVRVDPTGKVTGEKQLNSTWLSRPIKLDETTVVGIGPDMTLDFFELDSRQRAGRLVGVRNNAGWVAMDQAGDFDGNDVGLQAINFELKGQLFGVDQFLNEYFRPGVLARLIPESGKKPSNTRTGPELTAATLKMPPTVEVLEPTSGTVVESETVQVKVKVTDRGAGVSGVGLIHNGHKLPENQRKALDSTTYVFTVRPVKGKNEFRATAFDGTRSVEARQDRVRVLAPNIKARPPKLHVLSVGVNRYSSGLSLKFALEDAKSVIDLFDSGLYEKGERRLLSNSEATLSGINAAIRDIAQAAEPQDAFVLYLAGHGTVIGETYFFLPQDVQIESDDSVKTTALSSEQLAEALRSVPATKQLMVLDSCRSGAAVGVVGRYFASRAGLEEIRSQQLLARASGTFLIAATKGEDYAYEIPQLGHGVLTYAILESLGIEPVDGEGAAKTPEEGVTANDLLRSVSVRVPYLSEKYQGVRQQVIQYSSGQDFPLVK
jgi:WD40 repeat protein